MGSFTVLKALEFAYGHRIQGHQGRCGHLHGHNARAEVVCRGPTNELGMVVDFAKIRAVTETWISRNWDHSMVLQKDDPFVELLRGQGEPVAVLEGPPTAENMAAALFFACLSNQS